MQTKTEYHKEMYKDAVAPLPLDIAVIPVTIDTIVSQRIESPVMDKQPLALENRINKRLLPK